MFRCVALAIMSLWALSASAAGLTVDIGYLKVEQPQPPTLSNLDPAPADLGLAGANVGLSDNNTTGKFLGQTYALTDEQVAVGGDFIAAAKSLLANNKFLILDAPADAQQAIADLPEAANAILFNASSGEMSLRNAGCRANLLHSLPSVAMRTDALAQMFVKKRWTDLVLIAGEHAADIEYADALRQSLRKFGLSLEAEKTWAYTADMRRNAKDEVPLFTQDFGDYDALVIADEVHDFGRYVLYNTWQARPIAGSEGLSAITWSAAIEQWGAAQLQSRFEEANTRDMAPLDYAAWAAVRTIGEAVTRTKSADPATLRAFILSDAFELAGFKGRPLTYRTWNGQLRQPIAIAHPRALVAQAPLEGFLHRVNEMDTLGLDQPESQCKAFE